MNLICKLTDNDIGEQYIELENPNYDQVQEVQQLEMMVKLLYLIKPIKMSTSFLVEEQRMMKLQKKHLKEKYQKKQDVLLKLQESQVLQKNIKAKQTLNKFQIFLQEK